MQPLLVDDRLGRSAGLGATVEHTEIGGLLLDTEITHLSSNLGVQQNNHVDSEQCLQQVVPRGGALSEPRL